MRYLVVIICLYTKQCFKFLFAYFYLSRSWVHEWYQHSWSHCPRTITQSWMVNSHASPSYGSGGGWYMSLHGWASQPKSAERLVSADLATSSKMPETHRTIKTFVWRQMIHSMRFKCLGTQNPMSSPPALANFVFSNRARCTETSAESQVPWKHRIELT